MADIFEQLKMKIIIDAKDLQILKTYIADKYPDAAPRRKALILSDAIHQILDQQLQPFEGDHRVLIKKRLFERLQPDTQFNINAFHVFEACSLLESQTEEFWDSLGRWAAMHQDQVPDRKILQDMVLQIRRIFTQREVPSEEKANISKTENMGAKETINGQDNASASANINTTEIKNTMNRLSRWRNKWRGRYAVSVAAAVICGLFMVVQWNRPVSEEQHFSKTAYLPTETLGRAVSQLNFRENQLRPEVHITERAPRMPMALRYRAVDQDALRRYLESKDSMLAQTPYFENILQVAEQFDIHPLLIFAITGQEQGFVPKSHPKAQKIVNNPYNVFGSWETYNTDITDASEIAARTLVNLSQDCPEGTDIFQWINRKYAEDPNWHVGVSQIFKKLVVIAGE